MNRLKQRRTSGTSAGGATSATGSPGKRALTDGVRMRQAKAKAEGPAAPGVGEAAAAAGGGAALPGGVQDKMERSFGQSFGDVRVHEGPQAAAAGAQAYAEGSDLHFAPGKYDPHSAGGQELLGHELAHVAQQRAGRVETPQRKEEDGGADGINADPALEAEADAAGANAAQGLPATAGGAAAPLDSHGTPDAGPPENPYPAKGLVNADGTKLRVSIRSDAAVVDTLGKDSPVEITHDVGNHYKVVAGAKVGYLPKGKVTIDDGSAEAPDKETEAPKAADPYQGIIAKSLATLPIEDGGTFWHLPADFGLQMVMKGCNLSKQLPGGMGSNDGWLRKKVDPCFKEVGAVSGGPQFYAMVTNPAGDHFIARTAVHAHTVGKDGVKTPGHFPGSLEGFWIHPDWEKRMESKK